MANPLEGEGKVLHCIQLNPKRFFKPAAHGNDQSWGGRKGMVSAIPHSTHPSSPSAHSSCRPPQARTMLRSQSLNAQGMPSIPSHPKTSAVENLADRGGGKDFVGSQVVRQSATAQHNTAHHGMGQCRDEATLKRGKNEHSLNESIRTSLMRRPSTSRM